jgi:hypothetical protein
MCVYAWNSHRPLHSQAKIIISVDLSVWSESSQFGKCTQEGTESDCIVTPDGNLLWIIRRDISRKSQPGSALYLIDKNGQVIDQTITRIKFDSPLFISYHKNLFLVSRSQLRFKGNYLIGFRLLPKVLKTMLSLVLYWLTQKTTTLWQVDSTTLSLSKIFDLPSQGDTGYCGYVDRGPGKLEIYNYSTVLEAKNASWRKGQKAAASIYRYGISVF